MESYPYLVPCEQRAFEAPSLVQNVVHVTAFERKMRGGCQASLVHASNGRRYILKMSGNPQGDHTLFNEAFGSELAGLLGFPVQPWRPLHISEFFVEQNQGMWFEGSNGSGRIRPTAGIHFGSEFIEPQQGGEIFEMIPTSWVHRIQNAPEFLGMFVFDLWVNHADRRQAILVQQPGSESLRAVFIDHGQLFAKSEGAQNLRRCAYWDQMVYAATDRNYRLETWARRIASLSQHDLSAACAKVPRNWQPRLDRQELLVELQGRQRHLVKKSETIIALLESGDLSGRKSMGIVPVSHTPRLSCGEHHSRSQ
jgi:hypothetical protein